MIHSFLMIGQSNMAGRGFANEVPVLYDEKIKMLRNGRWQTMVEPVNYDRPNAGVSLAGTFAAAWRQKNPEAEIGLIPCAEGGSSLEEWAVGGALFTNAINQAKLAQQISQIDGILWHQGENDCFPERAAIYAEKFAVIVDAFRHELKLPNVPLVIGGLGDFLTTGMYGKYFEAYPLVNQALETFSQKHSDCYFVTAAGLSANPDGLHFNAISLRKFGVRYFHAFDNRESVTSPLHNEDEMVHSFYQRPFTAAEKIKLIELSFSKGELSLEEFKSSVAAVK